MRVVGRLMREASTVMLAAAAAAVVTGAAGAQAPTVGDPQWDRARLLELTRVDPWAGRPGSTDDSTRRRGAAVALAPLTLRAAWNSARPWGVNDGALWQGRGSTLAVSGGVTARWGPFTAAFRPIAMRNENRGFALSPLAAHPDLGPFSYPTGLSQTLDMPQRFGDGPFETFDLGESFIRADVGPVAAGLSNETLWWGPGRRNAIAMTNNAPGFGHVFLGTSRPLDVRIGQLDARWHWGRLRESRYFDADAANDSRYFTGLVARFTPKGVPGLELGVSRTFLSAWRDGGPDLDDVLLVFIPLEKSRLTTPGNPTGDDATDQMATLFARWTMPEAGVEVYAEWGRGDHSWDLRDLFVEPEHASAWLLGLQKAVSASPERVWRVAAELALLGSGRTTMVRAPASAFYVHHIVRQGYTQRGQVMGAGIGPGSSQAFLGLDRFARWGRVGLGLQRTVYDNNRFYAEARAFDTHEVEPAVLLDALVFRGPWEFGAGLGLANLMNKHYVARSDEGNLNLNLTVRHHFGAR